jgi:hypothetical protein
VTLLKMSASWNLQKLRSHKDPTLIFMMLLSSLITVELAQFHMLILETVYPLSEYSLLLMKLTFFSNATTLTATTAFQFNNNATGTLTIVDNASGAVGTIASGGAADIALLSNGTVGGTWDVHAYIPENVQWGTNSLALGSTVISGGTWQGGTIATGYGGTGLTSYTAGDLLYYVSGTALSKVPIGANGYILTSNGSAPTWAVNTAATADQAYYLAFMMG